MDIKEIRGLYAEALNDARDNYRNGTVAIWGPNAALVRRRAWLDVERSLTHQVMFTLSIGEAPDPDDIALWRAIQRRLRALLEQDQTRRYGEAINA